MPVDVHPVVKSNGAGGFFPRPARILFSVPITLRHLCRGGVRATRGITLDLGKGGLGAIVQGDVQVGETVAIDLRLIEQSFTAVAIVRHASSLRAGFEFVGLTPEERLQIATVVGHS